MRKVGDYEWTQLSMWDFAPEGSVQLYVKSGQHIFHYYLRKITEIVTDKHYKLTAVYSIEGVPENVLTWRNGLLKKKW